MSVVWENFLKLGSNEAECKVCKKILKCQGGSTKGLHWHLQNVHNIDTKRPIQKHSGKYRKKRFC